jgi:hypothetical protein
MKDQLGMKFLDGSVRKGDPAFPHVERWGRQRSVVNWCFHTAAKEFAMIGDRFECEIALR